MNGRGFSITEMMRSHSDLADNGLTRNSVTPASRASITRSTSAWPVIMMIGMK